MLGIDEVRLQRQRLIVAIQRAAIIASIEEHVAEIAVRAREFGIEFDCALARCFRTGEIALPPEVAAPVSVRLGEIRIQLDGAAEQFRGAVVIVEALQRGGEIAQPCGRSGFKLEGAAESIGGAARILSVRGGRFRDCRSLRNRSGSMRVAF